MCNKPPSVRTPPNRVEMTLAALFVRPALYLLYPAMFALAVLLANAAAEAERLLQLAADMHSLRGASRLAWTSLLEQLSFSWYDGATELTAAHGEVLAQAEAAAARSTRFAWLLLALTGVQLALAAWLRRGEKKALAWHVNLCAAPALLAGIVAPMLTVIASATLPVLGEVVLRYDSKSILNTVEELLRNDRLLLGIAIALFSVAVPLAKLVLAALVTAPVAAPLATRAARTLLAVGKWSMTDIFVVAILVAFLAFEKDINSAARLGPGLYFFACYCALSLAATRLAVATLAPVQR